MKEISGELLAVIEKAEAQLGEISGPESCKPVLGGGWSRRQVIGHLIDSASNNHQRFVRAALQPSLNSPGYDQDECVRVERPQEADWGMLVSLWAAYNRYLAHVIAHLPPEKLETSCSIGSEKAVTLRFLVEDYLKHLRHHLAQIVAD